VAALEVLGHRGPRYEEVLTAEALDFLAGLDERFAGERGALLRARAERRAQLAGGAQLGFLPGTREVREAEWTVPAPPADLRRRWVEITGPTDRKMVINALNSGADCFMADFEDANAPTWHNMVDGHINLGDAVDGTISHDEGGRHYEVAGAAATLLVRPRGWHLPELHVLSGGAPLAGALFDFGLHVFHCAHRLLRAGSGPYLYLPKLESHHEARLWNDVFVWSEDVLGLPRGAIRATVLIETLPAAFEMDEILFELGDHAAGLNAGRWDYIFSTIKCFPERPEFVLPDRSAVTMTVPFMRAYAELLVATCHRRGAHAIGGMAALIPSRADSDATERAVHGVRADKEREAGQGFDGSWVAHPGLVPVVHEVFETALLGRDNQVDRRRDDVRAQAVDLLDVAATPGAVTERGLRLNTRVCFEYISNWLDGRGAAAINGLMEDVATAEISRSQLWQWIHHAVLLDDGRAVTRALVAAVLEEEMHAVRVAVGEQRWLAGRPTETRALFHRVALSSELVEFLTLPALEYLDVAATPSANHHGEL
jgi:malate synthase